tara:strand:+ start:227 stop:403 length:177 start_codon:yes stop_codon:yes gene_type:complete
MTIKYKLTKDIWDSSKEGPDIIVVDSDPQIHIMKDPQNPSYQEYLEWVAAGNTPEAAD